MVDAKYTRASPRALSAKGTWSLRRVPRRPRVSGVDERSFPASHVAHRDCDLGLRQATCPGSGPRTRGSRALLAAARGRVARFPTEWQTGGRACLAEKKARAQGTVPPLSTAGEARGARGPRAPPPTAPVAWRRIRGAVTTPGGDEAGGALFSPQARITAPRWAGSRSPNFLQFLVVKRRGNRQACV